MNKKGLKKSLLYLAIGICSVAGSSVFAAEETPALAGQETSVPGFSGGNEPLSPQSMKPSLATITTLTTKQEADEGVSIRIEATDKIQYTAFKLYNPLRLILDLPQMQEGTLTDPIEVDKGPVSNIRPMYFGEAEVLRLEIALNREVPYNISKPENNKLLVTLKPASQKAQASTGEKQAEFSGTKTLILASDVPSAEDDPPTDPCDKILSGKKEKLSLDFYQADLKHILKIISETGGFNLVFAPDISGTLAMRLDGVPWNQAFNKILRNNGLNRECFKNIVRVFPQSAQANEGTTHAQQMTDDALRNLNLCEGILIGKKPLISFDFKQASLLNTLRFISEVGSFNLVVSPDVSGTLTMRLTDVPWNLALFMVLRNNGLDQECSDNIVRIASRNTLAKEEAGRLAAERSHQAEAASLLAAKSRLLKRFSDELSVLKPIPFELYRKIQENDSPLHANLEHYAKLFQEKSRLEVMERKSYTSLVKLYKQLIDEANNRSVEIQASPLQTELDSMKFVGVLWSQAGPVALIETADAKGHTVRPGTLVGPNFGVVELIEPEKIVIVERNRDYLGHIKSNSRKMELH